MHNLTDKTWLYHRQLFLKIRQCSYLDVDPALCVLGDEVVLQSLFFGDFGPPPVLAVHGTHVLPQVAEDFATLRTLFTHALVDHHDVGLQRRLGREHLAAVGAGLGLFLHPHVDRLDVTVQVALLGEHLVTLVTLQKTKQ